MDDNLGMGALVYSVLNTLRGSTPISQLFLCFSDFRSPIRVV